MVVWLRPIVKGGFLWNPCVCVRVLGPQTGRKRVGPAAQLQNSGFVFLLFPSVRSQVLKKQSLIFGPLFMVPRCSPRVNRHRLIHRRSMRASRLMNSASVLSRENTGLIFIGASKNTKVPIQHWRSRYVKRPGGARNVRVGVGGEGGGAGVTLKRKTPAHSGSDNQPPRGRWRGPPPVIPTSAEDNKERNVRIFSARPPRANQSRGDGVLR